MYDDKNDQFEPNDNNNLNTDTNIPNPGDLVPELEDLDIEQHWQECVKITKALLDAYHDNRITKSGNISEGTGCAIVYNLQLDILDLIIDKYGCEHHNNFIRENDILILNNIKYDNPENNEYYLYLYMALEGRYVPWMEHELEIN